MGFLEEILCVVFGIPPVNFHNMIPQSRVHTRMSDYNRSLCRLPVLLRTLDSSVWSIGAGVANGLKTIVHYLTPCVLRPKSRMNMFAIASNLDLNRE